MPVSGMPLPPDRGFRDGRRRQMMVDHAAE